MFGKLSLKLNPFWEVGDLLRRSQNPELPLKEGFSLQVRWGRWTPPVLILPNTHISRGRVAFSLQDTQIYSVRKPVSWRWEIQVPAYSVGPQKYWLPGCRFNEAFGSRKAFLNTFGIYAAQRVRS